jgi:hypothetical protein
MIHRYRGELFFSGDRKTDLRLETTSAALARLKIESLIQKIDRPRAQIDHFQEEVFRSRNLSSALDSGECSFSDLINLIEDERTSKFKQWTTGLPISSDLLREFDRSVLSESPVTKSVGYKLAKLFVLTTTSALVGAKIDAAVGSTIGAAVGFAADFALGATDEFLISKLRAGWTPNQWVNGPVENFFDRSS